MAQVHRIVTNLLSIIHVLISVPRKEENKSRRQYVTLLRTVFYKILLLCCPTPSQYPPLRLDLPVPMSIRDISSMKASSTFAPLISAKGTLAGIGGPEP